MMCGTFSCNVIDLRYQNIMNEWSKPHTPAGWTFEEQLERAWTFYILGLFTFLVVILLRYWNISLEMLNSPLSIVYTYFLTKNVNNKVLWNGEKFFSNWNDSPMNQAFGKKEFDQQQWKKICWTIYSTKLVTKLRSKRSFSFYYVPNKRTERF